MVFMSTPCSRALELALAGLLSWLEHRPIHQKVVSLMPGQDTYLGCQFGPWWGCVWAKTDRCFSLTWMFLSLSLSVSSSLSKINKNISLGED